MSVRRIYVEKRQDYAVKAKELKDELKTYLGNGTFWQTTIVIPME